MRTKLATKTVEEINHLETGKRIRAARESIGMSLRRFASQLGKSPAFISDLERGRRNWTKKHFNKALDILNK